MRTPFLILALVAVVPSEAHAGVMAFCAGRLEQALRQVKETHRALPTPIDVKTTGMTPSEAPPVNATRALGLSGIESPFIDAVVPGRVDIRPEDSAAAARLAAKYGVAGWRSNASLELLERVYQRLKTNKDDPLRKSQVMSSFCRELEPLLAHLPDDVLRETRYMMADAVLSLEEWQPKDFVTPWFGRKFAPLDGKTKFIHLEDYPGYVESYVEGKAPYSEVSTVGGGGVLSISSMRDAAAQNLWPIAVKDHDVRHPHFALGHPRAMAMYFKAARSKSSLRFILMSSMYEGVDFFQFSHEHALARYMAETMHMDLEQAMVYLGTADEAELERVAKAAGARTAQVDQFISQLSGWRPKAKGPYRADGKYGAGLDAEVDAAVAAFTLYANDSKKSIYTNYKVEPEGGASRQDGSIRYWK